MSGARNTTPRLPSKHTLFLRQLSNRYLTWEAKLTLYVVRRAAAETSAAVTAPSVSAARRVLGLFECVAAILEQVLPAEGDPEARADKNLRAMFGDAAADDERAAARATLQAAVRVNHTWYMAGLPILWRCPSEDALAADAIPSAARRAFYAAHIRHVALSKRGALWRAIARSGGTFDEGERGGDGGGATVGSSDASEAGNMSLSLPRLSSLNVSRSWSDMANCMPRNDLAAVMRHNLAVLVPHISPRLEEFTNFISAPLLDRLSALPVQQLRGDAEGGPGLAAEATHAPQLQQEQSSQCGPRLRKLNLHRMFMDPADFDTERRLLAWLAEPRSSPSLFSVELGEVFYGPTSSLADHAFRHFALRRNLKKLWLGMCLYSPRARVSEAAINDVAAWAGEDRCDVEYFYYEGQFRLVKMVGKTQQRPFQLLRDLLVSVDNERSVVRLVPLLAGLTRLSLSVGRSEWQRIDAGAILRSLSTLQGLSFLDLRLVGRGSFASDSLVYLRSLTQLQRLNVETYDPVPVTDASLVALLAPLRDLRTLRLNIHMRSRSCQVIRVIGLTCRKLRVLKLHSPGTYHLAPTLENDCQADLFPHLSLLEVPPLETSNSTSRYVKFCLRFPC